VTVMPTADSIREKALQLAQQGTATEEGVRELFDHCEQKRVPVVLARQSLLRDLEESPDEDVSRRAVELLDGVLQRLPRE
jgi:hypothetical protein